MNIMAVNGGRDFEAQKSAQHGSGVNKSPLKVYKVLHFLHKCIDSLWKGFINTPKPCGALFMMDGCTFFGLENLSSHSLPL